MRTQIDSSILLAALMGYQMELEQVNKRIQEIRRLLGGREAPTLTFDKAVRRHLISAEGRARIAAAQRKRWAEAKKTKAASA